MDSSNILQGIGVFVCVGAVVLVALIAFAVRAMSNRRGQANSTMWNSRGSEQPRYDDPNIESSGGFGSVPATGGTADVFDSDQDLRRNANPNRAEQDLSNRPLHGGADRDVNPGSQGGFGGEKPRRDDDVRSSGGFGGG